MIYLITFEFISGINSEAAYLEQLPLCHLTMKLRSESISSASESISSAQKEEIIPNVNMEMVENIWHVIEKRVSMFFLEEKNLREELLDELASMREENSKLKDSMNNLKLLLSSQNNLIKASIAEGESDVAIGNSVVNICSQSNKQKIENQLLEVRNSFKDRFYNQRSTIVQERPIVNPSPDNTDTSEIQPATINIEIPMDPIPTDPIEKAHMPTRQSGTQSLWPAGTTLIVGDSMLGGIEESRLGPKRKVRSFPGATIADMFQYIVPLLRKKPSRVVAHVGTNDASFSTAKEIADDLNKLQNHIHSYLPECLVIISSPINRLDDHKKAITIRNVNVILKNMSEISLIDIINITAKHLGKRKLHLDVSGSTMLARNILDRLRSI